MIMELVSNMRHKHSKTRGTHSTPSPLRQPSRPVFGTRNISVMLPKNRLQYITWFGWHLSLLGRVYNLLCPSMSTVSRKYAFRLSIRPTSPALRVSAVPYKISQRCGFSLSVIFSCFLLSCISNQAILAAGLFLEAIEMSGQVCKDVFLLFVYCSFWSITTIIPLFLKTSVYEYHIQGYYRLKILDYTTVCNIARIMNAPQKTRLTSTITR